MLEWLERVWPFVASFLVLVVAVLTAGHAILHKRNARAALLWVLLIWLAPVIGAIVYLVFGIDRIKRRAKALRSDVETVIEAPAEAVVMPAELAGRLPGSAIHLASLARLVDGVVRRPLLQGNAIEPLCDGEAAFPAMWEAIDGAQRSVTLSTYIFDRDDVGRAFVERLAAAMQRGVEVRVLIDDTGARYSFPLTILPLLRRAELRHARFHSRFLIPRSTINMRNHRKICVVDGAIGFTGGINLKQGHVVSTSRPGRAVRDVHFRLTGPVVAHLQEVFVEDWLFTTGERLAGTSWFPPLPRAGHVVARGIAEGPDEDFEKRRWTILGALATARRSVKIATPYFLPDEALTSALSVAALRGVSVDVLLPARNNIRLVQWAMQGTLEQILRGGCRVWLSPPPFDHAKLMVVDDHWSLVGSANWDPRSLHLNFEFDVEAYDASLAATLTDIFERRRAAARGVELGEIEGRSLPVRLRDGVARLLTPVL